MKEKAASKLENLSTISRKELIKRARKFSKKYCVGDGKKFRLKEYDTKPYVDLGPDDKPLMKETLQLGVEALATMQDVLYAQDKWSVLVIFQAMDAAGKDGAIKHVMSGVNPQGCQVSSFKAPSSEDLDHDFLWRCQKHLPERGRIGIFNRSYYEEVLVVRVHENILRSQKLPEERITKEIWTDRFKDIRSLGPKERAERIEKIKNAIDSRREKREKRQDIRQEKRENRKQESRRRG